MLEAIITVGISGSGKSTWARDFCEGHPNWVEINRDNIRSLLCEPEAFNEDLGVVELDWSKYKFTKKNEQVVTEICNDEMAKACEAGKNIVISDTNLNPKYRLPLIEKLESWGYEVGIKEFPITLEEAWERDSSRKFGVGKKVLYQQWQQWLTYTDRKRYVPNEDLPFAIVCDIDGTVADMTGVRGPFDWGKVDQDKPRREILQMLRGLANSPPCSVIFLSGRDGSCRDKTLKWLEEQVPWFSEGDLYLSDKLLMREAGDNRKDTVIKEELFWEHIAPNYNVRAVIDDRPCMIRLWYDMGIKNVISVGNPYEEF